MEPRLGLVQGTGESGAENHQFQCRRFAADQVNGKKGGTGNTE